MDASKPWYLSRTIWASLVTVALSLAGLAGLSVGNVDGPALADGLLQAVTAMCGVVAILSRVRARNRIG